jgi:hypothetical protein
MKKIIILMMIVFISKVYADNSVNLYEDYLPDVVLKNSEFVKMVSKEIEKKARINPDLIYYYIEYLNCLYDQTKPDSIAANIKHFLDKKQFELVQDRNLWAKRNLEFLAKMNIDSRIKNKASQYFKNLILNIRSNPLNKTVTFEADSNKQDFFSYLFLSGNKNLSYNPDQNYTQMKKQIEDKLIIFYNQEYQELKKSNKIPDEKLTSDILKHWYLFKHDTEENNNEVHAFEFIYLTVKNFYTFKNQKKWNLGIQYVPYNTTIQLKHSIPIKDDLDYNIYNENLSIQQLSVFVGYKFFLKNYIGPLSFINLKLTAGKNISKLNPEPNKGFSKHYSTSGIDYNQMLYFTKNELDLNSVYNFSIELSSPLYIINKSTYIEGCIFSGINIISFKTKYKYNYSLTSGYYTGSLWNPYWYVHVDESIHSEEIIENKTDTEFVLFPSINIKYLLKSDLSLKMSIYYKYLSISVIYSI